MTGVQFVLMLLSLGVCVAALTRVNRLLAEARVEILGRARDRTLHRARHLTAIALTSVTAVAAVVGYASWPSGAAPVALAHGDALKIGRHLQLSHALSSDLGPHLGEQQHVADRR